MAGIKMRLDWSFTPDPMKPVDGFRLWRKSAAMAGYPVEPMADIPFVSGQANYTYDDVNVVYGTTYTYGLVAYGMGGESAPWTEVSKSATVPAPNAPSSLAATPMST